MNPPSDPLSLIHLDDHDSSPAICTLCYSTLNSLHKVIFIDMGLETESGESFINILLNYARYFNFQIVTSDKKGTESNKIAHIIYQKRMICQLSIDELYQLIQPRIGKSKNVEKYKKDLPDNSYST